MQHFLDHLRLLALTDPSVSNDAAKMVGVDKTRSITDVFRQVITKYFSRTKAYVTVIDLHFSAFIAYMSFFLKNDDPNVNPGLASAAKSFKDEVARLQAAFPDQTKQLPNREGLTLCHLTSGVSLAMMNQLGVTVNDALDTFIRCVVKNLVIFDLSGSTNVSANQVMKRKIMASPQVFPVALSSKAKELNSRIAQYNERYLSAMVSKNQAYEEMRRKQLAKFGLRSDLETNAFGKVDKDQIYISFPNT